MIRLTHPSVIVFVSTVLCAVLLISIPTRQSALSRLERLSAAIARSWAFSLAAVFVIALTVAIAPSLVWGVPLPRVHDEYAYLLAGDTFAHFRLTNPPHPMATFLETFHVIQTPTYASKFPVGQGMALAIGYWLRQPIVGVWLSTSAACAAVAWMLRAFAPPRWALIGGIIAAFHPLIAWWNQTYWGGGVAMLGGALLVGGAARSVRQSPCLRYGIVCGIGLALLANSRPLEGLLLALLVIGWTLRRGAVRLILPCTLVLAPAAVFMGYYNWRVTNNALTMPYLLHARQYMVTPLLFAQGTRERPVYHHQVFEDFYAGAEVREYQGALSWRRFPIAVATKWATLAHHFFKPLILAFPMLALLIWRRESNRAGRLALLALILLPTLHMFLTPWLRVVYWAPLVGLFVSVLVCGLRNLTTSRLGAMLAFLTIFATIVANVAWANDLRELSHDPLAVERQHIVNDLLARGGKHLVVVTYGPNHDPVNEYVYNGADIDGSPVVFARSMGDMKNRELLDYFNTRTAWDLCFDDRTGPQLYPHAHGF